MADATIRVTEPTIWVKESPPGADRRRWYVGGTPGFDSPEAAVAWARARADTVIVRTLGPIFHFLGERPDWREDALEGPVRPWPPSPPDRQAIEATYRAAVEEHEALVRHQQTYAAARDAWLQRSHPQLSGRVPHRVSLGWDARGRHGLIELEEFAEDVCAGRRDDIHAFGGLRTVIADLSPASAPAGWPDRVCGALVRDRRRSVRRTSLLVTPGRGELLHLTASSNRESIRAHGLDWRRMQTRGIAGNHRPALDGSFLTAPENADLFRHMARVPTDVWSVRVDGIWLESDPNGVGAWWVAPEPLSADRLRLLEADLPGRE